MLEKGIAKVFNAMSSDEMLERVREIIEAIHDKKMRPKADSFAKAKAESLGSSNWNRIVKAAIQGRVDTLLVEKDKMIPGQIDFETGQVQLGNMDNPKNDDVFDDLAELVLYAKGNVLVLNKEIMPTDTGIAAIFRYKE